jgi:hypothetical protein
MQASNVYDVMLQQASPRGMAAATVITSGTVIAIFRPVAALRALKLTMSLLTALTS